MLKQRLAGFECGVPLDLAFKNRGSLWHVFMTSHSAQEALGGNGRRRGGLGDRKWAVGTILGCI